MQEQNPNSPGLWLFYGVVGGSVLGVSIGVVVDALIPGIALGLPAGAIIGLFAAKFRFRQAPTTTTRDE